MYHVHMKKCITIFFVVLGVLFLIQLVLLVYLYVADPLNLKPLFFSSSNNVAEPLVEGSFESDSNNPLSDAAVVPDTHPALSASQESALKNVGINPATLPSSISPDQEQCFIEAIGVTRVEEIKAGDAPTPTEIFKARECL